VENFPNPPIQEAILDIFVSVPGETTLEKLKGIGLSYESRFPVKEERVKLLSGFQFKPTGETSTTTSRQVAGYLFRSLPADAKAFQVRLDGFSFNKLRLYDGWTKFSTEAKEIWLKYRSAANPTLVNRLSLRYINRIEIPLPIRDFADYCPLFPNIPAKLPQKLISFLMSYSMPLENPPNAIANIILTFEPPLPGKPVLPLILDIGVSVPFGAPDNEEGIWSTFDSMRESKNQIFQSSLTEEALKLFR